MAAVRLPSPLFVAPTAFLTHGLIRERQNRSSTYSTPTESSPSLKTTGLAFPSSASSRPLPSSSFRSASRSVSKSCSSTGQSRDLPNVLRILTDETASAAGSSSVSRAGSGVPVSGSERPHPPTSSFASATYGTSTGLQAPWRARSNARARPSSRSPSSSSRRTVSVRSVLS